MRTRPRLIASLVALLLTLLASGPLIAQDAPPASAPISVTVPRIDAHLASLDGTDAMAYFRLAEEVAYEIPAEPGVELARTLYVFAYELSRDESGAPTLTRSVCLGLAALEPTDSERRRWLEAIATLEAETPGVDDVAIDDADTRLRLATALSHYRAEEFLKVRTLINRGPVQRYIDGLAGDERNIMNRVMKDITEDTACEVCRNDRVVLDRTQGGRDRDKVLCPRCQGNPGPRLSDEEYRQLLRFELNLLKIEPDSWAVQLDRAAGGDPLREASPDQLPRLFVVDPRATIFRLDAKGNWRDGRWVRPLDVDAESDEGA